MIVLSIISNDSDGLSKDFWFVMKDQYKSLRMFDPNDDSKTGVIVDPGH